MGGQHLHGSGGFKKNTEYAFWFWSLIVNSILAWSFVTSNSLLIDFYNRCIAVKSLFFPKLSFHVTHHNIYFHKDFLSYYAVLINSLFDYFLNRYKIFILIFTFLCYTSYHLSRKPISVVKVGVNKCVYNIIIVLWEVHRRPSPHWLCVHRTSKVVLELGHFLVALAWKKAVITLLLRESRLSLSDWSGNL